jgi:hypothetical protein
MFIMRLLEWLEILIMYSVMWMITLGMSVRLLFGWILDMWEFVEMGL